MFRQRHFLYYSCLLLVNSTLDLSEKKQYFWHLTPQLQFMQREINFNLSLRKVQVKQSHYRPGQALRVPGG
jgi:hypothetical protein